MTKPLPHKEQSPAMQMVTLAWNHACSGTDHSWERFNQDVRAACYLAARSLRWDPGDLDELCQLADGSDTILRCLNERGLGGLYATAVPVGNMTFCTEYERFTERAPIIADDVRYKHGRCSTHARGRLCLDAEFPWRGETVTVTSFGKDGRAVVCSYYPRPERKRCDKCGQTDWSSGSCAKKVKSRYRIGRDEVIAERAERRRKDEIEKIIIGQDEASRSAFTSALKLDKLNAKSARALWESMPLKRIEAAFAKYGPKERDDE